MKNEISLYNQLFDINIVYYCRKYNKKPMDKEYKSISKPLRITLLIIGFISVGLGCAGIFLPVLPTTPFLLLSAAIFARTSPRFYNWLINNKYFGSYIHDYRKGEGIPLKSKIIAIAMIWISIILSVVFIVNNRIADIILIIIALAVSIYLISIKAKR